MTRPHLPPLEEVIPYLEKIWETRVITNSGPFHEQLEEALSAHLGVPHISLFNNGTSALITAIQALGLKGEVITTPYSFIATGNALVWNNITPVFVDIDPDTLNLDPARIEAAITPCTTGIMPVHCYGNPCDVDAIEAIAERHGIKVMYDAAHAFGVENQCGSVLNYGDLSVLSFHATKVFNTFEGGAIVSHDSAMKKHIDSLRNFGLANDTEVVGVGVNGKMSEFSAAVGLAELSHIEQAIQARSRVDAAYRLQLEDVGGITCLPRGSQAVDNYAYFPIVIDNEYQKTRDELWMMLREANVLARRYFFPLIPNLGPKEGRESGKSMPCPVAQGVAERVLCLPIYPELEEEDIRYITRLIAHPQVESLG